MAAIQPKATTTTWPADSGAVAAVTTATASDVSPIVALVAGPGECDV
jgi:hypothetical protein